MMLIPGVSSFSAAAAAENTPELIDEAGHVNSKLATMLLTLEALTDPETDHTTVQDALDGMNINKNT